MADEDTPQLSEADQLRREIDEKREQLDQARLEALHATHSVAVDHELERLRAESSRLDAELRTVAKPTDIQQSNQSTLDRAKATAALYDSGQIAGSAPMDVAVAQVVADENSTPEAKPRPKKATAAKAAAKNATSGGGN